jgi:hypothetical protein
MSLAYTTSVAVQTAGEVLLSPLLVKFFSDIVMVWIPVLITLREYNLAFSVETD